MTDGDDRLAIGFGVCICVYAFVGSKQRLKAVLLVVWEEIKNNT